MPASLSQIVGPCMRIQMSGVAPKALASRMAMAGDTPDWPLMRRERVVRLTPNAFAPSVTDSEMVQGN